MGDGVVKQAKGKGEVGNRRGGNNMQGKTMDKGEKIRAGSRQG